MNILLTGASGFIGQHLLLDLLAQGHCVTACCRHPEKILIDSPQLQRLAIDFSLATQISDWLPHLPGIDTLINSVGIITESGRQSFQTLHSKTPIALFQAAAQLGCKRIIQISALGADAQAASAYHLSKQAADEALRNLNLHWFILQPSIVYGDGARSSGFLHALAALPVHILADGGEQQLQPIHINDVLASINACLDSTVTSQITLPLVGPQAISYADFLQKLRLRLGLAPATQLSIPYQYAALLSCFSTCLGEPLLTTANLAMLKRGNSADPAPLTAFLGRPTQSLIKCLFNQPASAAERWHAGLYFFKPLLCWCIACVWLWSGITSLWFYPHALSYQLLADTGITGSAAAWTLYGLASIDIALGILTLVRYRPTQVMQLQLWIVLGYSLVLALKLPEFLFHPFGPVLKNLPFMLCLLIYKQLPGESA